MIRCEDVEGKPVTQATVNEIQRGSAHIATAPAEPRDVHAPHGRPTHLAPARPSVGGTGARLEDTRVS